MKDFSVYFNWEDISLLNNWEPFLFLVMTLFFLWFGKKVFDLIVKFKVDIELTTNDNKAFAISFTGYLLSIGIIVWGVVDSPSISLQEDVTGIIVWSIVGIVLLNISRFLNDKFLLYQFNNTKEIIVDKNPGTGAVEFGTYVGTSFIIFSLVHGEAGYWLDDVISTVLFFVSSQILFIIFGFIYQKITKFDLHAEIERDNIAAGVSFGLTLVSVGYLIGEAVGKSDSLLFLLIWFTGGSILLIVLRKITSKLMFPHHKLDDEISKDMNWGVSLIEGVVAFSTVLLLNSVF
ncbi:MAG: DUF350 domain-containing protein [Candidatus Delongbacteria bacterium]|nr:DUF350 domain-containing protein [Candidatus Delongbacteria bacterium]MBN2833398.1 DUF350 domain-containing protein [Candidatus Delongbacteria bacterium]